jgi:galactoside O-acetyltransferase
MPNIAYSIPFNSIGECVTIWPQAKIVNPATIDLYSSIIIDDFVFLNSGSQTEIGCFVHIGSFTSITGGGRFFMGDFSGLSGGVRIYTGNEDYNGGCLTNPTVPEPYRVATRSFVRIEKHSIVGTNSVILPGVTIHEGVAVGAGSVVTKDCEPWTVYAGSPARPIKARDKNKILYLEEQLKKDPKFNNYVFLG